MTKLKALLINPFIYDFSAYGFWSSPLGLLYIGSILRENGFSVDLIDCMEPIKNKIRSDGRNPFPKKKVDPPEILKAINKPFSRYGMGPEELLARLSGLREPDLVLITSIMTYWYPGTREVLSLIRKTFPRSKIVVGGIYPTLCPDHSAYILGEADIIIRSGDIEKFYDYIEGTFLITLHKKVSFTELSSLPYPCYDLYGFIPFIPLLTSLGCSFHCAYCATSYIYPHIVRRSFPSVLDEIVYWQGRGIRRFVFYDDSLLYSSELYSKPLLRGIANMGASIDIYNPNALNAAFIDDELALLLRHAGFQEVRIGLETSDATIQKSTGGKVNSKIFLKAVNSLKKAGFSNNNIFVYILAGLPFQKFEDVKRTIDFVLSSGCTPYLAEYTPIPHTVLFEKYATFSRYPILEDPLFQNNALFPFAWEGFTENDLLCLKHYKK